MNKDSRLCILDQKEFTRVGRQALGALWEAGQDTYERKWLGADSPQRGYGEATLLGWRDGGARLGIWRPHSGKALFFLYAREGQMDPEQVQGFLAAVKGWCRECGILELIGPMQFSTWHPYRFISKMGDADFFPGEQKMPEYYHADFVAAGFSDLAEFQSSWVPDIRGSLKIGDSMGIERRLDSMEMRTLAGRDLPSLLPEIHRVSSEIFRNNFAFAPIALGDFLALSAGDVGAAGDKGSESVLMVALAGEKTAGFCYGYSIGTFAGEPGLPPGKTAVLKTLGVLPEQRGLGLGYGLSYHFHKHWLERGYASIIHAYMKTDNRSLKMSGHVSRPFRTYALMQGVA